MALAVALLIIGMSVTPLPLTVAAHFGVLGIGLDLGAMVAGPPLALAIRLAANDLIRPEPGCLKVLLTVTAGSKRQSFSPGIVSNSDPLRRTECFGSDIETAIEYLPRPRRWALYWCSGSGPYRLKWRCFSPAPTDLLKVNPPHITDQPILARMQRIGIAPGKSFDLGKAEAAVKRGLERAAPEALKAM